MSREIPKPLRNALARPAAGDVHPSPDVLTSFVEHTLAPVESEVVTHHLAHCVNCREIVFLASDAAEDHVIEERELVAAVAARRVAAMPAYPATSAAAADARAEMPRSRWTLRMRWAMSVAAAALLVSAGLVLQFLRAHEGHHTAPITVASNLPAPVNPEAGPTATAPKLPATSAESPGPAALANATPHRATATRSGRVLPGTTVAHNSADELPSAPAPEPAPQAASSRATADAIAGMSGALVPAVRPQSSFVESETGQALQLQKDAPASFGAARMGSHAMSPVRPQWRISADGHLERSIAADQWTRVLDDQPTTFRSVAVLGNAVWAGGNGGALFHSSNGGEHWSRVSLAADSIVETGAIVSIRFLDPQRGIVTTDRGIRWGTTDGGITWTMQ
jgi:Photosynthesis system II assembly factor YCF48